MYSEGGVLAKAVVDCVQKVGAHTLSLSLSLLLYLSFSQTNTDIFFFFAILPPLPPRIQSIREVVLSLSRTCHPTQLLSMPLSQLLTEG